MYTNQEEKELLTLINKVKGLRKKLGTLFREEAIELYIKQNLQPTKDEKIKILSEIQSKIDISLKAHLIFQEKNIKYTLNETIELLNTLLKYKKKILTVWIVGAILIFVPIPTLLLYVSSDSYTQAYTAKYLAEKKKEREKDNNGNKYDAWAYTKIYVENHLKSPSSADFPFGGAEGVQDLGGGLYSFSSYVDSQNGFGATIRTNFSGEIQRVDGGWKVTSFKLSK